MKFYRFAGLAAALIMLAAAVPLSRGSPPPSQVSPHLVLSPTIAPVLPATSIYVASVQLLAPPGDWLTLNLQTAIEHGPYPATVRILSSAESLANLIDNTNNAVPLTRARSRGFL